MPTIKRTTTRNRSRLQRALINVRDKYQLPNDLITREASIVPTTLTDTEGQHTVSATIATDSAVPIWDPYSYEVIDEVLLSRGMMATQEVPLLADHNRYQVSAILGRVSDFVSTDHRIDATLTFGHELDDATDGIWRRVAQGLLKTVSAGYAYQRSDSVEIPPGGTAKVNGMDFTAGTRMMRVVKKWKLREVSMVVIPADELAQLRAASPRTASQQGTAGVSPASQPEASARDSLGSRETPNNSPQQFNGHEQARESTSPTGPTSTHTEPRTSMHAVLTYLRSLGLIDNASVDQTRSFVAGITDAQRSQLNSLITQHGTPAGFPIDAIRSEAAPAQSAPVAPASPVTGERGQAPATQAPATPAVDPVAQERQRQSTIRNLAGEDMPSAIVERALNEGMSIEQAGILFANQRSTMRPAPLTTDNSQGGQAPFGHVANRTINLQTLQAALCLREGVQLDDPAFRGDGAQAMFSRDGVNAAWIHQANRQLGARGSMADDHARAMDAAYNLRHMSMVDFGRAICQLAGVRAPEDPTELFERVSSTMLWQNLFTTAMTAQVIATYENTPDPTDPFVTRTDVPNFLVNERIQLGKLSMFKKEGTNSGEAQHVNSSDRKETFKIERFIGQLEYDDKAFVNDQFNTIDGYTIAEMGQMARQVAADLVFGILLGNPTMGDSVALFNAGSHSNDVVDAGGLSSTSLKNAWAALGTQTENGRPLQLFAQNVIVSIANQWLAEQLVGSQRNVGGTATSPELNPAFNKFQAIGDSRIDNGVIDHAGNGALIAGAPTTFYVAAKGGRHTIEVAYLRGTGRAPRIITKELPGARIGKIYMVYLDAMAKALDWRGLYRVRTS